jgi:hypothetical protein
VPDLPQPFVDLPNSGPCVATGQYTSGIFGGADPSIPTKQSMPTQGGGSTPASYYYPASKQEKAIPAEHRTPLESDGRDLSTIKSRGNKLARRR